MTEVQPTHIVDHIMKENVCSISVSMESARV